MDKAAPRHTPVAWLSLVAFILVAGRAAPSDAALTRGPYLQSVTPNSAIIVWRTAGPGNSRVDYGVGDYTYTIELAEPTTEHFITLTGLLTDTQVMYRVSTDDVELASSSFRTPPNAGQPVTFGVLGDSGTGSRSQYAVADRLVTLDPQLVLHTGDVVYPSGQASGYDPFFFKPYQALAQRAPIYPTLGNHDYATDRGQPYLDAFYLPHNNPADTERYYSFDWGDAHFTALDFNTGPDAAQLEWLRQDLAATDKPWKFVFYHQAIYSSGLHGHESWVLAKQQLLAPIFEQYHVDVVFNGHDHDYERTRPINGVIYIVSGGGGGPLYPVAPQSFSAYVESTYHAVFATLTGCKLMLQAIKPDGAVFDSTTLTKNCPPPLELKWPLYLPVVWKETR